MASNNYKKALKNEVEQLTRQLNRITIEKEIIERKLLLAQDKLANGIIEHVTNSDVLSDHYKGQSNGYPNEKNLEIGNFVKILNPKPGQEKCGRIEGFYKDGKVKILTDKGLIIRRLPHNIDYVI